MPSTFLPVLLIFHSSDNFQVKEQAKNKYNYSFGDDSVSPFITAFYDAVILYTLALNRSIEANETAIDGIEITKRMWNTTFKGITGDVHIDENGDRIADYSLLDMNENGTFEVSLMVSK